MDEIVDVIDRLQNLSAALSVPAPAETHCLALREVLPEIRAQLKAAYLSEGGEDYWGDSEPTD